MLKRIRKINKITILVIIITLVLFFIPFFWFKPGELALGGDSSRLYYYNTWAYLKSIALYMIDPEGIGKVTPGQYLLPFLLFLIGIKFLVHNAHMLISTIDGLKLAGSFLFIYLIVMEILKDAKNKKIQLSHHIAGIIAGLFYTFSPCVTEDMKYALLVHNQVFLNPIMFYLLLKFLKERNFLYLWTALLVTCIFTSNFALQTPPPLFAFYPLALLFLYIYIVYGLKKTMYWKGVVIGALLFLGLQAFQIIPGFLNAFDSASIINNRIFDNANSLNYFDAIRGGLGKVSLFILYPSSYRESMWWGILFPLFVIGGFIYNKKRNTILLITFVFFFITLLLVSANITNSWVALYRLLFYVPGFSMFRNFSGQWQFVFTFFYALVIGQTAAIFLSKLKEKYIFIVFGIVSIVFIIGSFSFISGKLQNATIVTTQVSTVVAMDPEYEKTLRYMSSLSTTGKMLLLPLNDFMYQIVHGTNNGAYAGASTVAYIAGMPSYTGYQSLGVFGDEFLKLSKEKNYPALRNLLGILDVKYIFHNADPKIYDTTFATFPYGTTKEYLPADQKNMTIFAKALSGSEIHTNGNYHIYKIDDTLYPGDFSIPSTVEVVNQKNADGLQNVSFVEENNTALSGKQVAYLYNTQCEKILSKEKCKIDTTLSFANAPQITYKKINLTKYLLEFHTVISPFILVQSSAFSSAWHIYNARDSFEKETAIKNPLFNRRTFETLGLSSLPQSRHALINGYANAWVIMPSDIKNNNNTFIVEMADQRIAYICFFVSLFVFLIFLCWGVFLLRKLFLP